MTGSRLPDPVVAANMRRLANPTHGGIARAYVLSVQEPVPTSTH